MARRVAARGVLAILAVWPGAACYRYASTDVGPALENRPVRVDLTDAGTVELRPILGPSAVRLEGKLQSADDSVLTLAVTELVRRNGVAETWKGETVRMRRSQLARVEKRRFSSLQTGTLVGLLAGGGVISAIVARGGTSVSGRPPAAPPAGK